MIFQNPSHASQRIRNLWQKFEQSQAKDRFQLDITVQTALAKAEAEWNKTPLPNRTSRIQRNATKAKIAKGIKAPYFDAARAKWLDMLEPYGLKPDYWTDMTEDEKRRITNTLGAEDESDEDVVVPESQPPPAPVVVQPPQAYFVQPIAPSFSTSSRATNLSSSSYAFVNPSEFNSEEEDFEYEFPFSNPVATSVDLTSEDDDDPIASLPSYPGTRASLLGSAFSRASLSASNLTPSARPLVSGFAYNAAPSGGPTKRPPQQPAPAPSQVSSSQNDTKSTTTTKPQKTPRQPYVGPSLDTADEPPIDEDIEFEKFKMKTRITKIVEFHEAAALAEISLSIEMYKARKQLNSKDEDAPRVLEHQKRMVQLQKEKEEERKAIVKSERARRESELARRSSSTSGDVKKEAPPKSNAFKTWDPSSFQEEEINTTLPSRFNLDTLLSEQTNVESLLSEMFSSTAPNGSSPSSSSAPGFFNNTSSSNPDVFFGGGGASIYNNNNNLNQQEHLRHSSMSSWNNKTRSNSSPPPPPPQRKTHLSPFGEYSDDDEEVGGSTPASIKPNGVAPTLATTTTTTRSGWHSKDGSTPVNGAWSNNKKSTTTAPTPISQQPRNNNPSFAIDEMDPEPTATPFMMMNSKAAAKGKKGLLSTSDKSPVLPSPAAETPTAASKAAAVVTETPVVPSTPAPAPALAPAGKKQTKKQRLAANKKGGGGAAAAAPTVATTTTAIPEPEPETEPVVLQQQRESPKDETLAAPNPITPQTSEHASWLPKMARARKDSEAAPPAPPPLPASAASAAATPSFSWDEITSTPRPASKIPAHLQESLKSEGTLRASMLKKKNNNLMADIFGAGAGATSSRTTLEQMQGPPPIAAATPVGKGPVWGAAAAAASPSIIPTSVTPGPSLWGKTKKDFEAVNQQPVVGGAGGGDPWVPGGFDGVGEYKNEGDGGGGGGGNEGGSLWGSISTRSKQNGKASSIPVKQSVAAAQRLRRVSEATASASSSSSSPAVPRGFGTKDLSSDIGKQHPAAAAAAPTPATTLNSNSKKGQGKKNGKGKHRATIEVVSDDEKDNIDILPQDSSYIMEPKVILEPKPSVPPNVYNPIIDFAVDDDDDDGAVISNNLNINEDDLNDIAYMASTFKPSTSLQDDFFGGVESRFSGLNPFIAGKSSMSSMGMGGTAADWGGMIGGGGGGGGGGKHARWTPSVTNFNMNDEEGGDSGLLPSFVAPPPAAPAPSRIQQAKSTPIWGQPNPSAKDKGKGKEMKGPNSWSS